jgi:hypothetical protein
VGSAHDPAELEADRAADAALRGESPTKCGCKAGSGGCPSCRGDGTIRRKENSARASSSRGVGNLALGGGRKLGDADRSFFETRMQSDFSAVRIHDDAPARDAAADLGARAFTLGQDIVFARGEYQPGTQGGRQLLAHELAHVAQTDGETIRREPDKTADAGKTPAQDPAHPTVLDLNGTLGERKDAFKRLVETTAVHRLLANQRNLKLWEMLVQNAIPKQDFAAIGLQQHGGVGTYFEIQDLRDPALRDLRAHQIKGEYRACTGCHIEKEIYATRGEREASDPMQWATPNQIRQNYQTAQPFLRGPGSFGGFGQGGAGSFGSFGKSMPTTYSPPRGSAEAQINAVFPDPGAVRTSLMRINPIVKELGEKYGVLTTDILPMMIEGKSDAVRCAITADIRKRHEDYGTLIGKIQGGEVGWEHFGPIVTDLMPFADSEVQKSIKKEMDDHHFWEMVERVVVGILTVAALILTIFPPTSALGLAAVAALDLTLANYGIQKGQEMIRVGEIYGLGKGADDVFTPAQQAAADSMVIGGWISMIGGVLQGVGGLARLNQVARMGPPNIAALTTTTARVGQVIQRGDYIMTIAQDGSIYVTVASRPDLVIVARGSTATLYQLTQTGGMRAIAVAQLPGDIATPAMSPLLLGAGGEAAVGGGGAQLALPPAPGSPLMLPPGPAPPLSLPAGPPSPLMLPSGATSPRMLPAGPTAPLMLPPGAASPLMLPPGPSAPLLLPAATEAPIEVSATAAGSQRVLITPPPREPLQLGPGNPTTYTWNQISRMRQPNLWQEREVYMQQLYGSAGQQHFPVPNTGGRYTDVPVQISPTQLFAGEVKSYTRWITVEGQPVRNAVGLTERIEEQIARDVWLRDNYPGYDPRWMFTDAPPTEALRQALRDARIPFIEYLP